MTINPLLWQCADCGQLLPRPWSACDCANLSGDRYLVTPLGSISVTGALPPEGLITGRAVPTALRTSPGTASQMLDEGEADQGAYTPSALTEQRIAS